ncbi:unnamed protein product [marine sediment metagenome]|uniref:Uncharacterized protein n=1 Tax=marine sediment metagenome TaxID=412755 RepID=X1SL68_9ZZZZ
MFDFMEKLTNRGAEAMGEAKRNLEEKKKAFEENPNDFVHQSDIIVGIVKGHEGVYPIFSAKVSRMIIINALYDLSHQGDMYIRQMDIEVAKKNKGGIITPGDNHGKNRIAT